MTIDLELKDETIDRQKLINDLAKTFQEIYRVRPDSIQFVARGTIPIEHKTILDKRIWCEMSDNAYFSTGYRTSNQLP